jgi:hypothetical protein
VIATTLTNMRENGLCALSPSGAADRRDVIDLARSGWRAEHGLFEIQWPRRIAWMGA